MASSYLKSFSAHPTSFDFIGMLTAALAETWHPPGARHGLGWLRPAEEEALALELGAPKLRGP